MDTDIKLDFNQPEDGYGWIEIEEEIPKKARLVVTEESFFGGNHPRFGLYTNVPLSKRKTVEDENGTTWYQVQSYRMKKKETELWSTFAMFVPTQRYRKLMAPIPKGTTIEWCLFSEGNGDPERWFDAVGITFQFV